LRDPRALWLTGLFLHVTVKELYMLDTYSHLGRVAATCFSIAAFVNAPKKGELADTDTYRKWLLLYGHNVNERQLVF